MALTVELPSVAGEMPTVAAPDTCQLRLDRCVIEVSVRVFGRPVLRGRFRPTRGALTRDTLEVDLSVKSLRTNVPLLHGVLLGSRWLWAARHRTMKYRATVDPVGPRHLDIVGTVRVRHAEYAVPLRARVVHSDDDAIVLSAMGVLARERFPRRLHVEVAAELGT